MRLKEFSHLSVDRSLQHLLRARPNDLIQRTPLIELSPKRDDLRIANHWI